MASLIRCPKALFAEFILTFGVLFLRSSNVLAQEMPAEYQDVLTYLGKKGDFKDNVFKLNIPRSDLQVNIAGIATRTPFGFGGWLAMTKGDGGMEVIMGDLVLLENEVNPVMLALLDNGLEVTALHNHFFWETPRIFYMHVHGHGSAEQLARKVKPALELIGHVKPSENRLESDAGNVSSKVTSAFATGGKLVPNQESNLVLLM